MKHYDYDKLTKPVCCFITFEDEDGCNRALDYTPRRNWCGQMVKSEDTIMGEEPLVIIDTCEPTNIIWENRQIEGAERIKRFFISSFIIVLLISLSFTTIMLCKQYGMKVQSTYPKVNCSPFDNIYGSRYEFWAT